MKINDQLLEELKALITDGKLVEAMKKYRLSTSSDSIEAHKFVSKLADEIGGLGFQYSHEEDVIIVEDRQEIERLINERKIFFIIKPTELFICKPLLNTKRYELYIKEVSGKTLAKVLEPISALEFSTEYLLSEGLITQKVDWSELDDTDFDESDFPDSAILLYPNQIPKRTTTSEDEELDEICDQPENPPNLASLNCGWIYILANSSMKGILKIGRTDRTPSERSDELSAATGVPTPFVIVWEEETGDSVKAEAEIHRILENHRVNLGREFFQIDTKTAITTVTSVCVNFPSKHEAHDDSNKAEREIAEYLEALKILAELGEIDPRIIRMKLGVDFERSRQLFDRIEMTDLISKSGKARSRDLVLNKIDEVETMIENAKLYQ